MKKFLLFIIVIAAAMLPAGARAETEWTYAELTVPGDLANILGENAREIEALEIVGPLDDSDFHTLWDCIFYGKLSTIDMLEADLIDGMIPDYAFCNPEVQKADSGFPVYSNLSNIYLPKNLKGIGKMAFACTKLQHNFTTIPDNVTTVGDGAFMNCPLSYFYMPASCRHIGKDVFMRCIYLQSLELPGAITEVPEGLCSGCLSLTSINIPETVVSIGKDAFAMCRNLSRITLPEGLERINEYAFTYTSPEKLVLPSTLSFIGEWAFGSILTFPEVYSLATNPPLCDAVDNIGPFFPEKINGVANNTLTLYVPEKCSEIYGRQSGWNQFKKIIEMPQLGGIGSIEANDAGVSVAAVNGGIEISGDSCRYEVVDINGRIVSSGILQGHVTVMCQAGIYIVKTDAGTTKIKI